MYSDKRNDRRPPSTPPGYPPDYYPRTEGSPSQYPPTTATSRAPHPYPSSSSNRRSSRSPPPPHHAPMPYPPSTYEESWRAAAQMYGYPVPPPGAPSYPPGMYPYPMPVPGYDDRYPPQRSLSPRSRRSPPRRRSRSPPRRRSPRRTPPRRSPSRRTPPRRSPLRRKRSSSPRKNRSRSRSPKIKSRRSRSRSPKPLGYKFNRTVQLLPSKKNNLDPVLLSHEKPLPLIPLTKENKTTSRPNTTNDPIVGDDYKPIDLSIHAGDSEMAIEDIRKVLWEDYDNEQIYGKKFIVPVRGYFCRLCQKFYQSSVSAFEKHTRSELHFKNLKRLLSLSTKEEVQEKQAKMQQIKALYAKKKWENIKKEDEVAAKRYTEGAVVFKPKYSGADVLIKQTVKPDLSRFLSGNF